MEILAPAGNLEKLKMAFYYDADAVYLSGRRFSLRSASSNFSLSEMMEARELATRLNKKIYLTLNAYMHDEEIYSLPEFIEELNLVKPDALIVSDLGAIARIRKIAPQQVIHLSTQASLINSEGSEFFKKLGVQRVILGRECSIVEASKIKAKTGLEVEIFIHGSMCMSYSGQCLLSNYTQGRDANRGGCAHTCRFNFKLNDGEKTSESYFYSSKDLLGIEYLEEAYKAGIDSLKIEGRMKSYHYVATCSKVYAEAREELLRTGHLSKESKHYFTKELGKISHRAYTEGNLSSNAGVDSVFDERENSKNKCNVMGVLRSSSRGQGIIEVRHKLRADTRIEFLPFKGRPVEYTPLFFTDLYGNRLEQVNPGSLIKMDLPADFAPYTLIRSFV